MKTALLALLLLGALWGARALAGAEGRWGGADQHSTFYDDGAPRSRATLVDGRFEGPASTWHRGGTLQSEGSYVRGERDGAWRFWNESGALDESRSGLYAAGVRRGPLGE